MLPKLAGTHAVGGMENLYALNKLTAGLEVLEPFTCLLCCEQQISHLLNKSVPEF